MLLIGDEVFDEEAGDEGMLYKEPRSRSMRSRSSKAWHSCSLVRPLLRKRLTNSHCSMEKSREEFRDIAFCMRSFSKTSFSFEIK